VELELTGRRSGVNALVQALEADVPLAQLLQVGDQVFERALQVIEALNNEGIAGAKAGERFLQAGAFGLGATHFVFLNTLGN
jgi:hypothetical protein